MLQMARQIQLAIIVLMGRVDIPMVAVVLWREDGVAGTPSRQQAPIAATGRHHLRLRVKIWMGAMTTEIQKDIRVDGH